MALIYSQHGSAAEAAKTGACNSELENIPRAVRGDLDSYVDVTVTPYPVVFGALGNYWINYTFEEYNGQSATIQSAKLEFSTVKGMSLASMIEEPIPDLNIPAGANATWAYKMVVSADFVLSLKQKGFYKFFLNTTFNGKNDNGGELTTNIKVPVELETKVAIIVDNTIYPDIKNKLQRYYDDVKARLKVEFIECPGTWGTPEAIRAQLKTLWQTKSIVGAMLFGYLPVAMWEFTRNANDQEKCPIPIFYEDLDGTFGDNDTDGYYDRHYWGSNDGPEIWVSFVMPPIMGQDIPSSHLDPNGLLVGGGLKGSYYSDTTLTNLKGTRVDSTIDFDWEEQGLVNNMNPDEFSIRWTGKIKANNTETFKFYTEAKGGVKLWIDNNLLISHAFDKPQTLYSYSSTALLTTGWHDIKLEYYENGCGQDVYGMIKLSWSSPKLKIAAFEDFLDKTHLYYTDQLSQPENALLFMDYCYGKQCRMMKPINDGLIYPLYGENIVIGGGQDNTNATDYLELLKPGSELTSIWSHAGSTYHHIKPKDDPGATTAAPYWKIRNRDSGLVTLIWGCHAGDFMHKGLETGVSQNLAANYAFNTNYGLASAGCTRSFGTTFDNIYYSWQNQSYLALGFYAFLDRGYNKTLRMQKSPATGLDKWVEDEVLMGDPFLIINHRPTELKIEIEDGKKFTNSTEVTLQLSCNNTGEMSLRNEGGTWTHWEAFTATKTWQLNDGPGYKKVEFKMRNSYGACFNTTYDVIGIDVTLPQILSMVINDGDEYTNNTTVKIDMVLTDDFPGSFQMSLSNDRVNWSSWATFSPSTTWNLTDIDGRRTVYLKVMDGGGNWGDIASDSIMLDTTPPCTIPKITGPVGENGWYIDDITIELTSEVECSDLEYLKFRVNNESWLDYTAPIYVSVDGYHNIEYYAGDNHGNQEPVKNVSMKIDSTPPFNLSIVINDGDNITNNTKVTLDVYSEDYMSGCWLMRLSKDMETWGKWVEYSHQVEYTLSSDGNDGERSVYLEVKDAAGNIADDPARNYITLDRTAPTIIAVTPEDGAVDVNVDTNITIIFSEVLVDESITESMLAVADQNGVIMDGAMEYIKENSMMIFTPESTLEYYTTYTIIILPGAQDLAGNALENEHSYSFTTYGALPKKVRDLCLKLIKQNVEITWQPPEDSGLIPLLGYNLYRRNGSEPKELIDTLLPYTNIYLDTNTSANNTYYYTISAFNAVGEGTICTWKSIRVPLPQNYGELDTNREKEDEHTKEVEKETSKHANLTTLMSIGVLLIIIIIIIISLMLYIFVIKENNRIKKAPTREQPVEDNEPGKISDDNTTHQTPPMAKPVQQLVPQQWYPNYPPPIAHPVEDLENYQLVDWD